jgi:hypothetical protein
MAAKVQECVLDRVGREQRSIQSRWNLQGEERNEIRAGFLQAFESFGILVLEKNLYIGQAFQGIVLSFAFP